jgi:hypothetical protein
VRDRHTRRLIRSATDYVDHGWPITRLAVPCAGACPCPLRSCVDPHLMLKQPLVIRSADEARSCFVHGAWSIALVTHPFEVFEVPAWVGAPLHQLLKTACPTAFLPATRRWQFFLEPGSVSMSTAWSIGGEVVGGSSGWLPAPGTWTESTGWSRWMVPPYMAHWTPYIRRDPIDLVIG